MSDIAAQTFDHRAAEKRNGEQFHLSGPAQVSRDRAALIAAPARACRCE
jgi:hypothetical protein